jgi:hypothetical protein
MKWEDIQRISKRVGKGLPGHKFEGSATSKLKLPLGLNRRYADRPVVETGAKGGRFYTNAKGNKVYVK